MSKTKERDAFVETMKLLLIGFKQKLAHTPSKDKFQILHLKSLIEKTEKFLKNEFGEET